MQKQERTKKAIIEAAEKEFISKGFNASRTMEIARKAGISHGMLHYYFRTKEQLFEIILQRKVEQMRNILLFVNIDNNGDNRNFTDRLCAMVERHFDFVAKNKELPELFIHIINENSEHLPVISENIQSIKENLISNLDKEIKIAIQNGEIAEIDPRNLVLNILTLNIFSVILYNKSNLIGINFFPTYEEYCINRKQEIITLIRNRLTLQNK